jgi:hydrogenase maturation protease
MNPLDYRCDTLVLGIGNLLWADEGFGIRALERLHADWRFRPGVRLLDGGTQGLYLLPYVEGCRKPADPGRGGLRPGPRHPQGGADDDVPRLHGRQEDEPAPDRLPGSAVGGPPARLESGSVTLIGCQPEVLDDYGGSLSDTVKARIPEA